MNVTKAREHYSAYYEGTLDPGLKQALERAISTDPAIASDYQEFKATVELLRASADVPIIVPDTLHDQIQQRIDKHVYDQKQRTPVSPLSQWRTAFFGGVAVVAIGLSSLAVINQNDSKEAQANLVPFGNASSPKTDFHYVNGNVELSVETPKAAKVTILNLVTGKVVEELETEGRLDSPLNNVGDSAVVLEIMVDKGNRTETIVLPGKLAGEAKKGTGTVLECAMATADAFRTPIILRANTLDTRVDWDFSDVTSTQDLPKALSDLGLTASVREDGFLILSGTR